MKNVSEVWVKKHRMASCVMCVCVCVGKYLIQDGWQMETADVCKWDCVTELFDIRVGKEECLIRR